jgi:hypothetical protein
MGKLTKIKQLKENYPDEPWRWKPEWNDGEIKGSSKAEAILLTVMALAGLGLSSPAVLAIPEELKRGNYPILLALLFWVVGGGLLWVAAKRARQWLKFGTLVFRPEPLPGSWGNTWEVLFRSPKVLGCAVM